MNKLSLPSFTFEASSTLTRDCYDFTAYLDIVSEEAILFMNKLGSIRKGSGKIIEGIVLDHILRFCGEQIKLIVFENAAVGQSFATTVALSQHLVYLRLVDVIVVFLDNNHGKYAFDMLFGPFQTKKRNTTTIFV